MVIQRKVSKKTAVKASNTKIARRRAIKASEDAEDIEEEIPEVEVSPEATDLLFEANDVAELIAEVTGEEVAVTADENEVTFEVGEEDVFTVTAEGDEEVLETSTKVEKKAPVKASRKVTRKPRARR